MSRVLSILSLGIAIAATAYAYYQHRSATPNEQLAGLVDEEFAKRDSSFTTAHAELKQQFETALDKQDQRMEQWNAQLTSAIQLFRQDGDALLKRLEDDEQLASQQRQQAFREELARYDERAPADESVSDALAGPANQSDQQPEGGDVEQATTAAETAAVEAADEGNSTLNMARLKVVTTALRPGSQDPALIVIENDGSQDALIERIRFRPESEFDATEGQDAQASSVSTTTIVYEPSDNTSERRGYHGIYDRQLQQKIRIPAGESLTLRVVIHDPRYEGWGFSGRLRLEYNGAEPLSVDSARVTFRSSDI
jgi:hypothetical protein